MDTMPYVSLCISTYNQEKYIRETMFGALSQDYDNLEIIVSDDCSSDSTFEIIKDITRNYNGRHKVIIRQNEKNLGIVKHYNKEVFELTQGELLLLSGGDDVLLPETVSFAVSKIIESGCDSAAFNAYIIDGESNQTGLLYNDINLPDEIYTLEDYLEGHHKTSGACRIIKRKVVETFGPLKDDCQTEDTPNLFRTFLYGKVGYCYTPNLKYRVHGNNISGFHNLMTKFNPKKIANQYQTDLDIAVKKGLINNSVRVRVQHHIDYYIISQVAIRKLYNSIFFRRFLLLLWYCLDCRLKIGTKISFIQSVISWTRSDLKAFIGKLRQK